MTDTDAQQVERRGAGIRSEKRDSRFWKVGTQALYMTFLFVILAGVFRAEHVQIAMGSFTLVAGLLLGGGTWTNLKERDVAQARLTNMNSG
jgi:hypothetical protein